MAYYFVEKSGSWRTKALGLSKTEFILGFRNQRGALLGGYWPALPVPEIKRFRE
jgi:hypothetical protein